MQTAPRLTRHLCSCSLRVLCGPCSPPSRVNRSGRSTQRCHVLCPLRQCCHFSPKPFAAASVASLSPTWLCSAIFHSNFVKLLFNSIFCALVVLGILMSLQTPCPLCGPKADAGSCCHLRSQPSFRFSSTVCSLSWFCSTSSSSHSSSLQMG